MKTIIFTDLDGTLLNSDSVITEYTYNVLKNYTEQGNILVLSSGRSLKSVKKVKNDLKLDFKGMYICASNGTQVYDCETDEIIFEERMNMDDVKKIFALNKSMDIHIQTYSDEELIVHKSDKESDYYCIRCPLPVMECNNPADTLKFPPCKMLAIDLNDKSRLDKLSDYISEEYPHLTTLFSNPMYLEIFSSKAGKGNSLRYLCEHLSIPITCSYAFGDEENDIAMLEAAGTGVAMKNANPILKNYANDITQFDNTCDGLARYIEAKINCLKKVKN